MERMKAFLRRVFAPGAATVLLCTAAAAVLLTETFLRGLQDMPLSGVIYAFSAYALVLVCVWGVRSARTVRARAAALLGRCRLYVRYRADADFRLELSLRISLAMNLLYAGWKLVCGIRLRSVWFGTLAAYYSLFAVMRFLLLRPCARRGQAAGWRRCRCCGDILLLVDITLVGAVLLAVYDHQGFSYPGYLIYLMALYAFYQVFAAVRELVRCRRGSNPIFTAAKGLQAVTALVAMFSLETAMLAQFPREDNAEQFRQWMTGATGAGLCLLVLALAAGMILQAKRRLRAAEKEGM